MASKTTNYGLNKHSPQDFYNVEARNENWDKIDEALAATDSTKITTKAAPADGDGVMIADSADGGKAKRLLWSSVKTALEQVFGDVRTAVSRHIADKSNPHGVTAEQVGAALSAKILSDDADLNSVLTSGMYRVSGSTQNSPGAYGQVLVISGGGDTAAQLYFPWEANEKVMIRGGNPISSKGGWGEWVELVTGQSIASQTVYAATYAKWGYNIGIGQKGLRNTILNPTEYTPNQNGEICWQYE